MSTEDTPVLLFVDVLGVRARWLRGGADAAEDAFRVFRTLITRSLKGAVADDLIHGGIESDSTALAFTGLIPALEVARKLYMLSFERDRGPLWLRGCIVGLADRNELRTPKTFGGGHGKVELTLYDKNLLEAIAVEKSGFKGMRLLVESRLITPKIQMATRQALGHLYFYPLQKLRAMKYPTRLDNLFMDYLWMGTTERQSYDLLKRIMAVRLRAAASDPEEFAQVAATQVIFHECAAILNSMGGRVHFRELREKEANATASGLSEAE